MNPPRPQTYYPSFPNMIQQQYYYPQHQQQQHHYYFPPPLPPHQNHYDHQNQSINLTHYHPPHPPPLPLPVQTSALIPPAPAPAVVPVAQGKQHQYQDFKIDTDSQSGISIQMSQFIIESIEKQEQKRLLTGLDQKQMLLNIKNKGRKIIVSRREEEAGKDGVKFNYLLSSLYCLDNHQGKPMRRWKTDVAKKTPRQIKMMDDEVKELNVEGMIKKQKLTFLYWKDIERTLELIFKIRKKESDHMISTGHLGSGSVVSDDDIEIKKQSESEKSLAYGAGKIVAFRESIITGAGGANLTDGKILRPYERVYPHENIIVQRVTNEKWLSITGWENRGGKVYMTKLHHLRTSEEIFDENCEKTWQKTGNEALLQETKETSIQEKAEKLYQLAMKKERKTDSLTVSSSLSFNGKRKIEDELDTSSIVHASRLLSSTAPLAMEEGGSREPVTKKIKVEESSDDSSNSSDDLDQACVKEEGKQQLTDEQEAKMMQDIMNATLDSNISGRDSKGMEKKLAPRSHYYGHGSGSFYHNQHYFAQAGANSSGASNSNSSNTSSSTGANSGGNNSSAPSSSSSSGSHAGHNKPPPGYICHRCNNPGHYKNDCPLIKFERKTSHVDIYGKVIEKRPIEIRYADGKTKDEIREATPEELETLTTFYKVRGSSDGSRKESETLYVLVVKSLDQDTSLKKKVKIIGDPEYEEYCQRQAKMFSSFSD